MKFVLGRFFDTSTKIMQKSINFTVGSPFYETFYCPKKFASIFIKMSRTCLCVPESVCLYRHTWDDMLWYMYVWYMCGLWGNHSIDWLIDTNKNHLICMIQSTFCSFSLLNYKCVTCRLLRIISALLIFDHVIIVVYPNDILFLF